MNNVKDIMNVQIIRPREQIEQINKLGIQKKWCISIMIILFIVLLILYFIKIFKVKKNKKIRTILFAAVRIIAIIISITYIKEAFRAAKPLPPGVYADVYYGPRPFFITGFYLYIYSVLSIVLDFLKNCIKTKSQVNKTIRIISYVVDGLLYLWLLTIVYFLIIDEAYYSFVHSDFFIYLILISFILTIAIIGYLIIKIIKKIVKGELKNGRDD